MQNLTVNDEILPENDIKSIIVTSLGFSCFMFGAGCFFLGESFSNLGYLGGPCVQFLIAASTALALYFIDDLTRKSDQNGSNSLSILVGKHQIIAKIIDAMIAINSFITTLYYYVLVLKMLMFFPDFFCLSSYWINVISMSLNAFFTLCLILMLYKPKPSQKQTSLQEKILLAFLFFVGLLLIFLCCIFNTSLRTGNFLPFVLNDKTPESFSQIVFVFSCQQAWVGKIKSLKNPTPARRRYIILLTMLWGFIFYFIMGFFSYYLLGNINSDIFTALSKAYYSFPAGYSDLIRNGFMVIMSSITLFCAGILFLGIGFQTSIARDSVEGLFKDSKIESLCKMKTLQKILTIIQIIVLFLFGYFGISPQKLLLILGAISEPLLNFILPCVAYMIFMRQKKVSFIFSIILCLTITLISINSFRYLGKYLLAESSDTFDFKCNITRINGTDTF